jgi:hypothetical protein
VSRKKTTEAESTWPSRPATEGAAVSIVVHGEERTLEATKDGGGWSITPTDADEARALERFGDDAFDPPAPPESEEPPEDDGDQAETDDGSTDDSAGEAGDGGDEA